jgi:hypothetical protein
MGERARAVWRVLPLVLISLVFHTGYGFSGIYWGMSDSSAALVGLGSASILSLGWILMALWRLRHEYAGGVFYTVERERSLVVALGRLSMLWGLLLMLFATWRMANMQSAMTLMPAFVISMSGMVALSWLWRRKAATAGVVGSPTLMRDADSSLSRLRMSGWVCAPSVAFLVSPDLWWLDSLAAMAVGLLILRDGGRKIREVRKPTFSGAVRGRRGGA